MKSSHSFYAAIQDFRRARRRAALEQIMARLTGKSADLLSFEEVREKLKVRGGNRQQLQEIPLDAIVGSVGRYSDFTRSFLPKQDSDEGRWAKVKQAMTDLKGVPPIEVYKIGDAYFVLDGNHRVSVARELDATHIEAYVTEMHTKVPLSPKDELDDLILKAENMDFLGHTQLDESRPDADLNVTAPGQYGLVEEHIQVHRYFMGLEQQRDISYEEAAAHWYDTVYLPVVQIIREQNLLQDFPDRTETDLYVWIAKHRAELERDLGWEVRAEAAAADLAAQASSRPERVVARVSEKLRDAMVPDGLESGPATGEWRLERLEARQDDRLFVDVLVTLDNDEDHWHALNQALRVAQREGSRLMGLHVVPDKEALEQENAQAIGDEFNRRCQEAGVPAKFVLATGKIPRKVCERSRWADLVVVSLSYPPAPQPLARLTSGLRTLLLRCPRPVLLVPETESTLSHALLAYDGSPKAKEALFVATYLAGRWQIPLTVVTVLENDHVTPETLAHAQAYLEGHGVQATYLQEQGPTAEAILEMAQKHQSDLIIMGGYGRSPVVEVVLGSAVDQVLRESRMPMLICR